MTAAERLKTIFSRLESMPARWSASIIAAEMPWERRVQDIATLGDEWVQLLLTDQYLRNSQHATFEVHNMSDIDGSSNDVWIAIVDPQTSASWQTGTPPVPSVDGAARCAVAKVKETVLLSGIAPDYTIWLSAPADGGGSAKLVLNLY